jgi:hypothetical protein
MRRDLVFLTLIICVAALLRLDLLIANQFVIDADEAIVGLMAKHISEGQKIPVFYYGQNYMGSLEALCVAGLFKLFGVSSVALKIVPFFFSLVLILVVYEITCLVADKVAARFAAVLCAIPPSALVIWSAMARGGFIEIVLVGALAFLLAFRWMKSERKSLAVVFFIGLLLGFGWWVNNQIIYFMIPIALLMLGKILWWNNLGVMKKLLTLVQVVATGFFAWILGGLPYWIYNIQNDWVSLEMFTAAKPQNVALYFQGFYQNALPILLGGARFWQSDDVYPGSRNIVYALYGLLLLVFIASRHKQILSAIFLRFDKIKCPEILLFFLIVCAAVFVKSSFGWLSQAPRYLLPMYVGIFVLSGISLATFFRKSQVVGIFVFTLILFSNLASSYWGGTWFKRSIPGEPVVFAGDRVSKDQRELIEWLKSRNFSWIRTNYWIGYRLAFESNESIKFIVNQEPSQTRIEQWPKEAKSIPLSSMPLVMVPTQARIIRQALNLLQIGYQEAVVSGYHVFYELSIPEETLRPVEVDQLSASANYNPALANRAIDGLEETRWGSGTAQVPDMEFVISLKTPTLIRALEYNLGTWPQDGPKGLQIEFEKPDGTRTVYFDSAGWDSIRYFLEMESRLVFRFPPQEISKVILKQTKRKAVFDWSIAEFTLYQ